MSAASRILRGESDRFGEETCERVLKVAQQLGWRRNLLVNGIQTDTMLERGDRIKWVVGTPPPEG